MNEPEREAQQELASLVDVVFSNYGNELELHLGQAAEEIADAMLDYFRPVTETLDVDRQMHDLDLAADEIQAAEDRARTALTLRRMHQEEALWRRQHPFRNLWAWVRGR